MRLAVVLNPRRAIGRKGALWTHAIDALRSGAHVCHVMETRGDGDDGERIAAFVRGSGAEVVVAAGGDGTVGDTVGGLLRSEATPRAALGILPLGTANDMARSLGLTTLERGGLPAVATAVGAILRGERRGIDIGVVNGHPFASAFAAGMDADILALRNRLRDRLGLAGESGGYALYLWSCAANVLSPAHGGRARVSLDGAREERVVYNALVANAPLYAGEFRFDGDNDCADGLLDLHLVAGAREYLYEYPTAWRRHVRASRGEEVTPSSRLRRAREIRLEFARPVASQVDGEQLAPSASYRVSVLPLALRACVALG